MVREPDQAEPANQVFLWEQRERCENPNLDRHVGLRTGRHGSEALGPAEQPLPNSTDFERGAFRENAHFTGTSAILPPR